VVSLQVKHSAPGALQLALADPFNATIADSASERAASRQR